MPVSILIENVFKIAGVGTILVGNIKSGTLRVGMKLNIKENIVSVKSMEMHHKQIQDAHEGEDIGFSLSGGDYDTLKSFIRNDLLFSEDGDVLTKINEKTDN